MRVKPQWPFIFKSAGNAYTEKIFPVSTIIGGSFPTYISFDNLNDLAKWYETNPIIYSAINIDARAFSNGRIVVTDLNSGDEISRSDAKGTALKIFELFEKPYPGNSMMEFLKQYRVLWKCFGNALIYGSAPTNPVGFPVTIENVKGLQNIYPQYSQVKLTGKFFDVYNISDLIEYWQYNYGGIKKVFTPYEIFYRNESNTEPFKHNLLFGMSPLKTLSIPHSNIMAAYDSKNVIIKNRGARFLITSDKRDGANARLAFRTDEEKKDFEDLTKEFGLRKGQKQVMTSPLPIQVKKIDQNITDLQIPEGIVQDAMQVCNTLEVPYALVKLELNGVTFENLVQEMRRLYQDSIIPSANDFMRGINNWLSIRDRGYEVSLSYDHVPCMQKNIKEEQDTFLSINQRYEKMFKNGLCTQNQWLAAMGLPETTTGNRTIFELTPEERAIILNKNTPTEIQTQQ